MDVEQFAILVHPGMAMEINRLSNACEHYDHLVTRGYITLKDNLSASILSLDAQCQKAFGSFGTGVVLGQRRSGTPVPE